MKKNMITAVLFALAILSIENCTSNKEQAQEQTSSTTSTTSTGSNDSSSTTTCIIGTSVTGSCKVN